MTIHDNDDVRLLKSTRDIWSESQKIIVKNVSVGAFQSWIRPIQLIDYKQGEAVIAVSNEFVQTMVCNRYMSAIVSAIGEVTGEKVTVKLVVDPTVLAQEYDGTIASITPPPAAAASNGQNSAASAQGTRDSFAEAAGLAGGFNGVSNAPGNLNSVSSVGSNISMVAGSYQTNTYQTSSYQTGNLQNGASNRVPEQVTIARSNLNPKYAFDSFVVGSHNRFSHSAAQAVAARPGQAYNPLFIYGGVGLGKTHLMHAIGHEILKSAPTAQVRYISCEKFTNELINSIRDDRMMDFRKRYRQIDVLLVDDIQFLQGKESTQEEFFHTFNALRDSGKQIVLSSDRPPKAIARLEERLRSRFEWGLISDVQAPDLETRLAILRKKCALEGMRVADEILEYIASLFTNNIRELEGALIRSHAYSNLTGEPLTVNALAGMLQPTTPARPKVTLTCDRIIDTVAAHYRVESSELRSQKRSQDLALPRHIAMFLAHDLINMSFPRIGEAFGNRKHTSALYAHSRIKDLMAKDPGLSQSVKQITSQLTD